MLVFKVAANSNFADWEERLKMFAKLAKGQSDAGLFTPALRRKAASRPVSRRSLSLQVQKNSSFGNFRLTR